MYSRQPYTLDRIFRLLMTVVLILGILWLVQRLSGVLLPFCLSCLIAYMMEPMVQFNRRLLRLKGRVVAIFVTLFEVIFFLGLLGWIFVPMIFNEVRDMAVMVKVYAETEFEIPYIPQEVHEFIRDNVDLNRVSDYLATVDWKSIIEETLTGAWNVIAGSITFLLSMFSWFIVLLYVIFIMIDYDRLGRLGHNMVPPRYRKTVFRISDDVKESMNHYFRGQALVAFIVGILFSVGFLICGLPLAIIMGLFIGVLNMVPYMQLISFVPVTLLCVVYSVGNHEAFWPFFGKIFLVYCVVQAIQDLFLTPKIMGKAMGLNPAIILLSLSVWGSLLGLLGLIIALPLTTLLLSYYNRYVIGTPRQRRLADKIEQFPDPQ